MEKKKIPEKDCEGNNSSPDNLPTSMSTKASPLDNPSPVAMSKSQSNPTLSTKSLDNISPTLKNKTAYTEQRAELRSTTLSKSSQLSQSGYLSGSHSKLTASTSIDNIRDIPERYNSVLSKPDSYTLRVLSSRLKSSDKFKETVYVVITIHDSLYKTLWSVEKTYNDFIDLETGVPWTLF
jgi:hypothetical protein